MDLIHARTTYTCASYKMSIEPIEWFVTVLLVILLLFAAGSIVMMAVYTFSGVDVYNNIRGVMDGQ